MKITIYPITKFGKFLNTIGITKSTEITVTQRQNTKGELISMSVNCNKKKLLGKINITL